MQLLLDNLSATIIATAIFMMLAVLTHRKQKAHVKAVEHYALRKHQIGFIDMLRSDMAGITRLWDTGEDPADQTFTFTANLGDDADTTVVTYKRVKVGERNGASLYQIKRYLNQPNSPNGSPDGASMSTITDWEIVAQNEQGTIPADAADARQVRVQFESVLPYTGDGENARRRWGATFHPRLLNEDLTL